MDSGTENNNSSSGIKESRSNGKGPLILFEKTVHDFGNMRPLSTNTAVYRFINAGDGVLNILDVKGCCGTKVGVSKRRRL